LESRLSFLRVSLSPGAIQFKKCAPCHGVGETAKSMPEEGSLRIQLLGELAVVINLASRRPVPVEQG
jgi:hypothetical protein